MSSELDYVDIEETKPPEWLLEYKRQLSLIDVFIKAFTLHCNCEVCQLIRKNLKYWEKYFKPASSVKK